MNANTLLLALQQAQEPTEVKYIVAVIAALASIVVAVLSAAVSMASLIISRVNQTALQKQQAELTQNNQKELANLQSQLSLSTQNALEITKAELAENAQTRLEALKSHLSTENQQELESLRAKLTEQGKERDARRDYEYDAHKRLYAECEPLLFQLAEFSEHAYYRIYSLARTARLGDLPEWLVRDGYYLRSTMHKLISPLVVFRLIQQRLTFVDLRLDAYIASQYALLKLLYLTFTDAFDFANMDPKIDYKPGDPNWQEKRTQDEAKYWRQGLYLGSLDNSIDALVTQTGGEKPRWTTYGEFELEFADQKSITYQRFLTFADVLHGFHPQSRPVLWRMLWTQSLIYERILGDISRANSSSRIDFASISPRIQTGNLDWRQTGTEASDDEALNIPRKIAEEYLGKRLPEIFAAPAKN